MRLVRHDPRCLELEERSRLRAFGIVGLLLLIGPPLMSLMAPLPLTSTRLAVAGFFVVLGGLMVGMAAPRKRRVVVRPAERTVTPAGSTASISWGPEAALRLVALPPGHESGRARYGVRLDAAGATPVVLLSSTDPARVLTDLAVLRSATSLPVVGGWGLPQDNPWTDRPSPVSVDPVVIEDADDPDSRRRIATTLLVGAGAIAALLAGQVSRRVSNDESTTPLSLVLLFLPIVLLVILGNAFSTAELRLSLTPDLLEERRIFGVSLRRRTIPRGTIRTAYLVSPNGAAPRHLLVETDGSPVALHYEEAYAPIVEQLRSL
jgi:hypothetical protein